MRARAGNGVQIDRRDRIAGVGLAIYNAADIGDAALPMRTPGAAIAGF